MALSSRLQRQPRGRGDGGGDETVSQGGVAETSGSTLVWGPGVLSAGPSCDSAPLAVLLTDMKAMCLSWLPGG